jgi:hypothetical protein
VSAFSQVLQDVLEMQSRAKGQMFLPHTLLRGEMSKYISQMCSMAKTAKYFIKT